MGWRGVWQPANQGQPTTDRNLSIQNPVLQRYLCIVWLLFIAFIVQSEKSERPISAVPGFL